MSLLLLRLIHVQGLVGVFHFLLVGVVAHVQGFWHVCDALWRLGELLDDVGLLVPFHDVVLLLLLLVRVAPFYWWKFLLPVLGSREALLLQDLLVDWRHLGWVWALCHADVFRSRHLQVDVVLAVLSQLYRLKQLILRTVLSAIFLVLLDLER